ncbi:Uncharacterised protein [Mesomycoplasma hyorhinis]|nr:Uncharacterised protein [Mesomycoplasma hyorhinis]
MKFETNLVDNTSCKKLGKFLSLKKLLIFSLISEFKSEPSTTLLRTDVLVTK